MRHCALRCFPVLSYLAVALEKLRIACRWLHENFEKSVICGNRLHAAGHFTNYKNVSILPPGL